VNAKGRNPKDEVYRMMLAAAVYYIWRERNTRVFQNKRQTPQIRLIIQEIHVRGANKNKLAAWL